MHLVGHDFIRLPTLKMHGQTQNHIHKSKLEDELDRDAVYHRLYSNQTVSILQMKLLKGLETSNTERIELICTVEYADDLAILAKEEMVLEGVSVTLKLEDAMEWK
jgi:hypothetical protein